MKLTIEMLPEEHWYGLVVNQGMQFPLNCKSTYSWHATCDFSQNQESPLLLSSCGRYLWSEDAFDLDVADGVLSITNAADDVRLYDGFGTLRGAFLAAKSHFPATGRMPPADFFTKPQYNTWTELIYHQTQDRILNYARGIVQNGMPSGILMIDDGWMCDYGNWKFNPVAFSDPADMIRQLHGLGFRVMLWIVPFVSPNAPEFSRLERANCLVRNHTGKTAIRKWWNGEAAILDLSNPAAVRWLEEQLDALTDMGADGFKFDAGDVQYYRDDDWTYGQVSAHEQCALWGSFGKQFAYNEYRAIWKCGGQPIVARLGDKPHHWQSVAQLVPDTLQQGILGYAYGCPDMIGGGSFSDFLPDAPPLSQELFVRYAQAAALMPMMQYSASPWRLLDHTHAEMCRCAGLLHMRFADRILQLAQHASVTNEPIVRLMEYVFPGERFAAIMDQFMLGDAVLVAPVVCAGQRTRAVRLPIGRWRYTDGTIYDGGQTVVVPAPLEILPYFEKI